MTASTRTVPPRGILEFLAGSEARLRLPSTWVCNYVVCTGGGEFNGVGGTPTQPNSPLIKTCSPRLFSSLGTIAHDSLQFPSVANFGSARTRSVDSLQLRVQLHVSSQSLHSKRRNVRKKKKSMSALRVDASAGGRVC